MTDDLGCTEQAGRTRRVYRWTRPLLVAASITVVLIATMLWWTTTSAGPDASLVSTPSSSTPVTVSSTAAPDPTPPTSSPEPFQTLPRWAPGAFDKIECGEDATFSDDLLASSDITIDQLETLFVTTPPERAEQDGVLPWSVQVKMRLTNSTENDFLPFAGSVEGAGIYVWLVADGRVVNHQRTLVEPLDGRGENWNPPIVSQLNAGQSQTTSWPAILFGCTEREDHRVEPGDYDVYVRYQIGSHWGFAGPVPLTLPSWSGDSPAENPVLPSQVSPPWIPGAYGEIECGEEATFDDELLTSGDIIIDQLEPFFVDAPAEVLQHGGTMPWSLRVKMRLTNPTAEDFVSSFGEDGRGTFGWLVSDGRVVNRQLDGLLPLDGRGEPRDPPFVDRLDAGHSQTAVWPALLFGCDGNEYSRVEPGDYDIYIRYQIGDHWGFAGPIPITLPPWPDEK